MTEYKKNQTFQSNYKPTRFFPAPSPILRPSGPDQTYQQVWRYVGIRYLTSSYSPSKQNVSTNRRHLDVFLKGNMRCHWMTSQDLVGGWIYVGSWHTRFVWSSFTWSSKYDTNIDEIDFKLESVKAWSFYFNLHFTIYWTLHCKLNTGLSTAL